MKHAITLCVAVFSLTFAAYSQAVTNEVLQTRINSAHAENNIALTFEQDSKTTKVMAVSENFSKDEVGRSGILAMNFAIGCFYPGEVFLKSPDSFLLTFWVLAKKPRFGANHALTVTLRDEVLVIGSAQYSPKPREQMEYLNFEISRESLTKIANHSAFRLVAILLVARIRSAEEGFVPTHTKSLSAVGLEFSPTITTSVAFQLPCYKDYKPSNARRSQKISPPAFPRYGASYIPICVGYKQNAVGAGFKPAPTGKISGAVSQGGPGGPPHQLINKRSTDKPWQ